MKLKKSPLAPTKFPTLPSVKGVNMALLHRILNTKEDRTF